MKSVNDFQSEGKFPPIVFELKHLKNVNDFQSEGKFPPIVFEPRHWKYVNDFQLTGKLPLIVFKPSQQKVIKPTGRLAMSKASDGEFALVTQPLVADVSLVLLENLV